MAALGRSLLRTRGTDLTGANLPVGLRGLLVWDRWADASNDRDFGAVYRDLMLKVIDADHTFECGDTFTADGRDYTITARYQSTNGWSRYGISLNPA